MTKKKLVTHCYWSLWKIVWLVLFLCVFHYENIIWVRVHSKRIFCHCHQFVYWHCLLSIASHLNGGVNVPTFWSSFVLCMFGQFQFFSRRLSRKPRCQIYDNNRLLRIICYNWKTINNRHNNHNHIRSHTMYTEDKYIYSLASWFSDNSKCKCLYDVVGNRIGIVVLWMTKPI